MLSGEESSFAVGLDGSLFEGGDVGGEIFDRGGGDGDQAGVVQDAVVGSEVGFLLENVVVLSRLGGILDLSDLRALGLVGDMCECLLTDVAGGLVRAHRCTDPGERPLGSAGEQDGGILGRPLSAAIR